MVRQCFLNKTGIRFRADLLKKFGLDPEKLSVTPQPDPTTSSSSVEGEDQADVISPINDQLSLSIYWWLYELIPVKRQHQKKCGTLVWKARYAASLSYIMESSQTPPISPSPGPTWATAGTSPTAMAKKSMCTERLILELKLE